MRRHLVVYHSFAMTSLGEVLLASTDRGLCGLLFVVRGRELAFDELYGRFPMIEHQWQTDEYQRAALSLLEKRDAEESLHLHLMGAEFELQVWQALLEVPWGTVVSYKELAGRVGRPTAYRAVGRAVGANPIAFIIPCHRVIGSSGSLGGYHWGLDKKVSLLQRELGEERMQQLL
ncbi:MAG: methylated-DNA--[protein]-cysteine S-methyltransferase [Porphyromonas sp.]|nr:methylated-DNA--[protein]-cysteine S-methyltransferase [Porphyromonas sp.]